MKYDDASWHYGGNFPSDLQPEAGATHTGMFLAWVVLTGHAGEELKEILNEHELDELTERKITPGAFFLKYCDGKFTDDDVAEILHEFMEKYFDFEKGQYIKDYHNTLAKNLPTDYHVPDTWESYDRIAPIIQDAYNNYLR